SKTVNGSTAGTITIGATSGSLTADSTSFTVVPGSADHLTVTSSTANLASGTNRTLTAELRDAAGNLISADNTTAISFTKTAGSGSVNGLGTATASSGIASKTVSGQFSGPLTLTAATAGL